MGHYALKCYTRPVAGSGGFAPRLERWMCPIWFGAVICRKNFTYTMNTSGCLFPAVLSEWVEGETLGRHVARLCGQGPGGALPAGRTFRPHGPVAVAATVCARDIKPDNILVEPSGAAADRPGRHVPAAVCRGTQCRAWISDLSASLRDERCFDRDIDDYRGDPVAQPACACCRSGFMTRYNDRENLILNAAEVAAGTSGLFAELGRNWIDAGRRIGGLVARVARSVPAVAGLHCRFRALTGDWALELLAGYDGVEDGDRACALICHGGRYITPTSIAASGLYPLWEEAQPCSEGSCHGTRRRMLAGDRCNRAYTEPFPGIHRGDAVARGCPEFAARAVRFIDAGGRESVAPVYPLPELFVKAGPRCGWEDYFYRPRRMQIGVRRICVRMLYVFQLNL